MASPSKTPSITGFINVQTLMVAHPGWREVEELNSALSTEDLNKPVAGPKANEPPSAYPAPLAVKAVASRNTALDESQRIGAIREPALRRIDRLSRTSGLRMERNITRAEADVEKKMQAALADNVQKLTQQSTDEKAAIRRAAHANLRDLGLQEIALGSELDSYALFPGLVGSVRSDTQKKLASVTAKRKLAELELAKKLNDADERQKVLLAQSSERIRSEAARENESFKRSEEMRVASEVSGNKSEIETVLSVLAPLDSPLAVKSSPVRIQLITPIVQRRGFPVSTKPSEDNLKKIREQRDRLVEFIRQDVMRRLSRLSSVNRWQISTTFSPFLPDKSKEVSDLLKAEWTP